VPNKSEIKDRCPVLGVHFSVTTAQKYDRLGSDERDQRTVERMLKLAPNPLIWGLKRITSEMVMVALFPYWGFVSLGCLDLVGYRLILFIFHLASAASRDRPAGLTGVASATFLPGDGSVLAMSPGMKQTQ
jgi:hypothetical protein